MITLLVPVVLIFILSYLANRFLVSLIPFNLYLVILFPGVVIHELSHFAFSIFTGTPVHGMQLFSRTGGHVIHEKPKIPVIGQFIISFAPLFVGIALSVYLIGILPISFDNNWHLTLSKVTLKIPNIISVWYWWHYLATYFLFSIILTLTPSKQDISASIAGILVFMIVLYFLKYNNWLTIPSELISILWYIISCLVIVVLVTGAFHLILRSGRH